MKTINRKIFLITITIVFIFSCISAYAGNLDGKKFSGTTGKMGTSAFSAI